MPVRTIKYGTITLPYSRLRVSQSSVYGDDGRTMVGTTFHFAVSGVFCKTVDESMTLFLQKINLYRTHFLKSRQEIYISVDGVTLYNINKEMVDDWGPKPQGMVYEEFMGGYAVQYTWTCQAFVKLCACGASETYPSRRPLVLGKTMEYVDSIDVNGLNTRATSGVVLFSRCSAPADQYREWVVKNVIGAIPDGFQRGGYEFHQSADGTMLKFRCVDREVYWAFPTGITSGRAEWSEHLDVQKMKIAFMLAGYFEAPACVNKSTTIERILALVDAKFNNRGKNIVFVSRELREDVYGGRISFAIQGWGSVDAFNRASMVNSTLAVHTIGVMPPGGNGPPTNTSHKGTADLPARMLAFYDACTGDTAAAEVKSIGGESKEVSSGGGENRYGIGASGGTVVSNSKVATSPIVQYHELISYEVDYGYVTFRPKAVDNIDVVIQQAHAPIMTIIQTGVQTRICELMEDIKIPDPIIGPPEGVLLSSSITPEVPRPYGDSYAMMYTVSWRYVMRPITPRHLLNAKWPEEPLTAAPATSMPALPEALDAALTGT